MRRPSRWASCCGAVLAMSSSLGAADTTVYSYDALGRLVSATVSGGPNNGKVSASCFDAAGNRTQYAVTAGAVACGSASSGASAPVPTNPTLNVASGSSTSISLATLANTSTSGAITAFTPPSGGGSASIASGGQSVTYTAPVLSTPALCDPAYTNTYAAPYSVQNAGGGASASGTATINVTSQPGPQPRPGQQCP